MLKQWQIDAWKSIDGWEECNKCNKPFRSILEWIDVAEKLAAENNGILPYKNTLSKIGFRGLVHSIERHPDSYKHIKQKLQKQTSAKEWVLFAENYVKQHGQIPTTSQLHKLGLYGFAQAVRKQPNLFDHLPKQKPLRPKIVDYVKQAEAIERNCGIVDFDIADDALIRIWKINPKAFSHIKYKKKTSHLEKCLEQAKQYVNVNGLLPSNEALRNEGYSGMAECRRKFPKLFSQFPCEKSRTKTKEQHKEHLTLLLSEYGIITPKLKKQNRALFSCIKKYPDFFNDWIGDSRTESDENAIIRKLRELGGIVSHTKMRKAMRRLDGKSFIECMNDLASQNAIVIETTSTTGRPVTSYRLVT
jgi:hypothetical protein